MSEGRLVPLRNRKGEVVNHAIVSEEDYDRVMEWKWYMYKKKQCNLLYAVTTIKNITLPMHHFIHGKPKLKEVVDHLNGNGLDNRKENLRFATRSQNNQNRNVTVNKTSKYIGVSQQTEKNGVVKMKAQCQGNNLGKFDTEEEAALMYDIYVYLVFGKDAKTNGLVTYEEAVRNKLVDIIRKRKVGKNDLPKNVVLRVLKDGTLKYIAQIRLGKKTYATVHDTIAKAEKAVLELKDEYMRFQKQAHLDKTITTNVDGNAIIEIKNSNNEIVAETLVDEDIWHELTKLAWCISGNYIGSSKGNLHTFIYKTFIEDIPDDMVVDHVNKNPHDNRRENLRLNTHSGNGHNRTKATNSSSKYYGVSYFKRDGSWRATITKDHKFYQIGLFKDEKDAALAYNKKAVELYGEFANLNVF